MMSGKSCLSTDSNTYISIDGNPVNEPVAYCHYRKHRGYLTPNLIKTHGCAKKQCQRMEKLDCKYWEEKKERKKLSKAAKKAFMERTL